MPKIVCSFIFLEPEREGLTTITSQDFASKFQDSKPWLIQVKPHLDCLHRDMSM